MRRIADYLVELGLDAHTYLVRHAVLPRRARITVGAGAMDEAYILEALQHPGVPRVYECGLLDDHRPWLAVELVEGDVLGRLSVAGVVALVRDVAEVLDHAHRRGVVHGNLRPEMIVKASPRRGSPVVVLDWGRACDGAEKIDDVRALGEVAYAALVGSLSSVPIVRRAPGAPPRLTALIDRMIDGASTAAQAHAEAGRLAELVDETILDDSDVEQEELVLDDIAPAPVKLRWTPALGSPATQPGMPFAMGLRRGPR